MAHRLSHPAFLPSTIPRCACSNSFPPGLWEKIELRFPEPRRTHPVCVDIAIGAEGRGGVELARRWAGREAAIREHGLVAARPNMQANNTTSCSLDSRGFHVVGVEADPQLLARTFRFAQACWVPAVSWQQCASAEGGRVQQALRFHARCGLTMPPCLIAWRCRRTAPTSSW